MGGAARRTILLAAPGSAGDVYPMLGLAAALAERGHAVRVLGYPKWGDAAAKLGVPYDPLCSADEHERFFDRPMSVRRLWAARAVRYIHPLCGLIERRHTRGSTVVVALSAALGAALACEKLGLPLVRVYLEPGGLRSRYDAPSLPYPAWPGPLARLSRLARALHFGARDHLLTGLYVRPRLRRIRRELGLGEPGGGARGAEATLGMFPRWFATPQPDWPRNMVLAGFPLMDGSLGGELPPDVDAFLDEGPPPVVFMTASQDRFGHRFYGESVKACALGGYRGLLLTHHRGHMPERLPEGVLHSAYAPLGRVLPRCLALVHHGGIGTAAIALAAGVPQVCVPSVHNQPDNAARVARLGVGAVLHPRKYREASALRAIREVTESGRVRERCAHFAGLMAAESGLEKACRAVESCPEIDAADMLRCG